MSRYWRPRRQRPSIKPTTLDIAWAAGVYEGEGAFNYQTTMRVQIAQADPWLLLRLQALFGGAVVDYRCPRRQRTYWTWSLTGPWARGFIYTIYSFLSPRRRQQIFPHAMHDVAHPFSKQTAAKARRAAWGDDQMHLTDIEKARLAKRRERERDPAREAMRLLRTRKEG